MANDKDIIKKLCEVVTKQQLTINKMAQVMQDAGMPLSEHTPGGASLSWDDVSAAVAPVVQQAAKAVGAKSQYGVQSAEFGKDSGTLKIKLQYPASQMGGTEAHAVIAKTKELLAGKNVSGSPVKTVEVIGVTV